MRFGTLVQEAVLEPEAFAARAVWSGGRRAGKVWDAFEATAGDSLTEREQADVLLVRDAVRACGPAADLIERSERELCMAWSDQFGPCKARIDGAGLAYFYDLKTTRDSSAAAFGKQFAKLKYDLQFAWYARALAASGAAWWTC